MICHTERIITILR